MRRSRVHALPVLSVVVIAAALAGCAAAPTQSASARPTGEVIDTVDLPPLPKGKSRLDFDRESVVSTRTTDDETVTEYRFKGQLYKMVVKPKVGAAYTLLDEKGEGKFVRVDGPGTRVAVPMWVLFSW